MTDIPDSDLLVRSEHQQGGQRAGILTGVIVTHLPSGIEVKVDIGRSQYRNRQVAIDAILGAITSPHYR